jgi:hypothetical protein
MKRADWIRTLAVTALMASACGSTPAVSNAPSPSALATPSASPTPASSPCLPPTNHCLALVTLRGSTHVVVRDITDINHPKTVGGLGALPAPVGYGPALEGASGQFVSGTELSYIGGSADTNYGIPTFLFRAPLSGSPRTTIVKGTQAVFVFAWNPSGTTVVYLTSTLAGMKVHQLTAGHDRVLASLPAPGVGGCEVGPCPGPFQNPGDTWDFRLAYSPDGNTISIAQNGINSFLWILSADGKVLSSSDPARGSMTVWSGDGLYFTDSKGIEVWRKGAISTFLPGVGWIRPKASPDGTHIVYEARDTHGVAHVFIVDTSTRQVRDLGGARMEPAFLTSRYIWYQAEPPCVATRKCQAGFPGIAAGSAYIYDLQDGAESASVITSVLDAWPHPA